MTGTRSWLCALLIFANGGSASASQLPVDAGAGPPPSTREYKLLRDEEDWSFLADATLKSDPFDAIKFIPFTASRQSFVSVGGEVRQWYERFTNDEWGAEPPDRSGYLLQRYMVHADAHFSRTVRAFVQVKSGLSDGRAGGPRPTDAD